MIHGRTPAYRNRHPLNWTFGVGPTTDSLAARKAMAEEDILAAHYQVKCAFLDASDEDWVVIPKAWTLLGQRVLIAAGNFYVAELHHDCTPGGCINYARLKVLTSPEPGPPARTRYERLASDEDPWS